jgi:hypothetical protein
LGVGRKKVKESKKEKVKKKIKDQVKVKLSCTLCRLIA